MRRFVCFGLLAALTFYGLSAQLSAQSIVGSTLQEQAVGSLGPWISGSDAILVVDNTGRVQISRNAQQLMIPASTTKLLTTLITLDSWGANHRWQTPIVLDQQTLWILGRGDPFLISEELVLLAEQIAQKVEQPITTIVIDSTYFDVSESLHRSVVDDPYAAPLSATAANFNTVQLRRTASGFESGEPQTPLTAIAQQVGANVVQAGGFPLGGVKRINLHTAKNAQRFFGELLIELLRQTHPRSLASSVEVTIVAADSPHSKPVVPEHGQRWTYYNSREWSQMLQGALKYSNNFITDQAFLMLSDQTPKTFTRAQVRVREWLQEQMGWSTFSVVDGSGLSRDNRLSVTHLNDVLTRLRGHKSLLREYPFPDLDATVFAKTGTLDNVRSMAGYVDIADQQYQFAFIFNRSTPWQHREKTLHALVQKLASRQ